MAVSDHVAEQTHALNGVRQQYVVERDLRDRLAAAVEATGARLVTARSVDVPWTQLRHALGGVNRAAANARWRTARDKQSSATGPGTPPVDPVLSGLSKRWGGLRPLREFQALEVAAEAGARVAGDRERESCAAETGRRDYEIDGLVDQTMEDAADAGRNALIRAGGERELDVLEAWAIVTTVASDFTPTWRRT